MTVRQDLIAGGISTSDSFSLYHPRVRDCEQIRVLKCHKSGVFLLDDDSKGSESVYIEKNGLDYWGDEEVPVKIFDDDIRRFDQFKQVIQGKKVLDFGCGAGGFLRLCRKNDFDCIGLEIQPGARQALCDAGLSCVEKLSEIEDESLDFIMLFHVFEHLQEPVEMLRHLKMKLNEGGKIIVEVPQANDVLLSLFDFEPFKDFTFWSEHLVLHTKSSLTKFGELAGMLVESVVGYQRYPLSNHLYWLCNRKPGGHEVWDFLDNSELSAAWAKTLDSNDMTDTIIATLLKQELS